MKNFFFKIFLGLNICYAGISEDVFIEGKIVGYDQKNIEILNGKKTIKIPIKDIPKDQIKKWKLYEHVSIKLPLKKIEESTLDI
ncbi:MAG: hypothetical protein WCK43_01470 [bacterium]